MVRSIPLTGIAPKYGLNMTLNILTVVVYSYGVSRAVKTALLPFFEVQSL